MQHGDHWTDLGGGTLFGQDNVRLIAISAELATPQDAIRVTLETAEVDPTVIERTVLSWSHQ